MNCKARDEMEEYDLRRLYAAWQEEAEEQPVREPEALPDLPAYEDLWSRLINGAMCAHEEELRTLLAEVNQSGLDPASKLWWNTVMAMKMDVPDEVLRKLCTGNLKMPDTISEECLAVAARLLAKEIWQIEEKKKEQIRREEAERETLLAREIQKKLAARQRANQELEQYRSRRM